MLPIRGSLSRAPSMNNSNPSLNQSPPSKLIDVNQNPTSLRTQNSYPRNLNELGGQLSNRFASPNTNPNMNLSNSKGATSNSRRNSVVAAYPSRSPSEKSTAESTSKAIDPLASRNRTQHNLATSIAAANKGVSLLATTHQATEPIQLFKKINELTNKSSMKASNTNTSNASGSMAENKRRISLLLARKSWVFAENIFVTALKVCQEFSLHIYFGNKLGSFIRITQLLKHLKSCSCEVSFQIKSGTLLVMNFLDSIERNNQRPVHVHALLYLRDVHAKRIKRSGL